MPRKSKQDWIDLAFTNLIENGLDALTAEPMARSLGVTRGSLYHHFKSRTDFLEQVLQAWSAQSTDRVYQLSQKGSPEERLSSLSHLAWSVSLELDAAIRAWALYDELARTYVEQVDAKRLAYITELYQGVSKNKKQAKKYARIAYFSFIGAMFYQPGLKGEEQMNFRKQLHELIPR